MASRDNTAQRIAALEAVVIQMLGEKFGVQTNGPRNLAAFFEHAYDVGGRSEGLETLERQAERRRAFINQHGLER